MALPKSQRCACCGRLKSGFLSGASVGYVAIVLDIPARTSEDFVIASPIVCSCKWSFPVSVEDAFGRDLAFRIAKEICCIMSHCSCSAAGPRSNESIVWPPGRTGRRALASPNPESVGPAAVPFLAVAACLSSLDLPFAL
jgi:hypothetical protein